MLLPYNIEFSMHKMELRIIIVSILDNYNWHDKFVLNFSIKHLNLKIAYF